MGWRPVAQRFKQEAKSLLRLMRRHAQYRKNARLNFGAMNTNASAAAFVAVNDEVIGFGANAALIGFQHGQILVTRGSEWMMVRHPSLFLLVPKERRKVDDPEDLEVRLRIVIELERRSQVGAQVAERLVHGLLRVGHQE